MKSIALLRPIAFSVLLGISHSSTAADCSAKSGPTRAVLVELFTSEGCDSCPEADRWLSRLRLADSSPDKPVVALAFHVDYWDRYGWADRFSSPAFTQRQKQRSALSGARFLYTPQVLVDGRDFPGWRHIERPAAARGAPGATLQLSELPTKNGGRSARLNASLADPSRRSAAVAWLALLEDGLVSDVRSGENAGKRLAHDFVVRDWLGPFAFDAGGRLDVARDLRAHDVMAANTRIAAIVESTESGEILQALVLAACRPTAPAR